MLDGCYGVMSALEVIRTLNDNSVATRHPLEVITFSNEEGVRYPMMIGSKVASGLMEVSVAYELKDSSGITYRQALESGDITKGSIAPARRLVGEIKSWVELHIEQGPVLESEGVKIGVVEGIVGLVHKLVTIRGRAGHAGTTPMIARHDPLLGCAEIIQQVNRIAKEISATSVGTVGLLRVEPGAMNVIPGKVEMGIDFRDIVAERMDRGMARIEAEIQRVCQSMGLEYALSERSRLEPQPMSRRIMNSIGRAATALGATHRLMPSGAGHDTQNMARICETGMIFVPSRNGISHAPDESTDPSDLALGADMLLGTILDLDAG
jgi:hydantoinase/carbamoylase family amidase